MPTYADYRDACALLWGPAGEFAADEFARLNGEHFAGSVPPLPIVIGLAAFGRCLGLTRYDGDAPPRITLGTEAFNGSPRCTGGTLQVSDLLLHEMLHAVLRLGGEDPKHNGAPWSRMLTELSPAILGREVSAAPVGARRVPNPARETDPAAAKTIVVRRGAPDGMLTRPQLAAWPWSLRPAGYYAAGDHIPVPTY